MAKELKIIDGHLIDTYGFKNKILDPINDSRLTPTMERTRSGSTQMFREALDKDGNPYRSFMSNDDTDVIKLKADKRSHYAALINGVWHWIEGCNECNGEPKDWMCYSVCDEHDFCSVCKTHSSHESITTRWGNKAGWVCNVCHDKAKAAERALWQSKILDEDDYCEWDFEDMGSVKCPYCTHEWDVYDSYSSHGEPDNEKEEKCDKCDNTFLVESQVCTTFTTRRKE